MLNAASGHLSIRFGLRGPNYAVATACASATNAMGDAFKAIQYGDADVMLTGGAEAAMTPIGLSGFANMKALSERNDDPAAASRPFDADRDGFVLSEGAGHPGVRGAGARQDARGARSTAKSSATAPAPTPATSPQPDEQGTGAARAMSSALRDAKLEPDGDRLHQRPRHEHAAGRQGRDDGREARVRATTPTR